MMIETLKKLVAFVLLLALLFVLPVHNVLGQATTPIPPATVPSVTAVTAVSTSATSIGTVPQIVTSTALVNNSLLAQELTLASLGVNNTELISPQGSTQFEFHIPDNWQPDGSSYLSLNTQFFRTGVVTESTTTIQVRVDNNPVSTFTLSQQNGETQSLKVPLSNATLANTARRLHTLQIDLNARDECLANQEIRIFIRSDMSFFHYEYHERPPALDLANYPRPLFNHLIGGQVDTAVIVLPTQYTASDLEAAGSLAAGLGFLTGNSLQLRTVTADALSDLDQKTSNLLLVGQIGSNKLINTLYSSNLFPTQLDSNGALTVHNQPIADTDGVVQIIASPQNPLRSILAVTSKTAEGLQKAALAFGGPLPTIGLSGPLALISEVRKPTPITNSEKMTFANLGYSDVTIAGVGTHATEIRFLAPAGTRVTNDAYLDLEFDFSDILRNSAATISVALNDTPVGSLALGVPPVPGTQLPSATPFVGSKHLRASIPPDKIRPGTSNSLTLVLDVEGSWKCYPPNASVTWFSVRSTSTLFLPQQALDMSKVSPLVSNFPVPYIGTRNLQDSLVVLPATPTASELNELFPLLARLGSETSNGSTFQPRIALGTLPDGIDLSNYDLIVVGRLTTNQFLGQLNDNLPQPFIAGSDDLKQVIDTAVYRLPSNFNIGVLQALKSPWSPSRSVLVITGTSADGQSKAMNALNGPNFTPNDLTGNVIYATANNVSPINTTNPDDAGLLSTEIPGLATESAQTGTPASTSQFSSTVTPGPTLTPTLTTTATPILSATPVSSPTSVVALATFLPTFEPLPPAQLAPDVTKQPLWVTGLEGVTGIVILVVILYGLISIVRRRQKGGLQP